MNLEYNNRRFMPLMASAFEAGHAEAVIQELEDESERDIATAELHYFRGDAEECVEIVSRYLDTPDISIRLSANMMYAFANLTLGDVESAQKGRDDMKSCVEWAMKSDCPPEAKALCMLTSYISRVLLHINPEGVSERIQYIKYLPKGIRLFAMYVLSHKEYLKGEYAKSMGMAQSALMLADEEYPIAMIYLRVVIAICQMNLKSQEDAKETISIAWDMAGKDKFIEPFIEHHGPMQGALESYIRKTEPQLYKKLTNQIIAFSRGWMQIHNPEADKKVTALLTPMEFSIAMLACRNWTNKEIAEYLELSVNTVKHYVSGIMEKLGVDKRDKIKEYVNQ